MGTPVDGNLGAGGERCVCLAACQDRGGLGCSGSVSPNGFCKSLRLSLVGSRRLETVALLSLWSTSVSVSLKRCRDAVAGSRGTGEAAKIGGSTNELKRELWWLRIKSISPIRSGDASISWCGASKVRGGDCWSLGCGVTNSTAGLATTTAERSDAKGPC
eukprot:76371-Rhodomonas_salina.1